ncbi:unnamed protein product [Adineta ricciae]|uniref:Uncharacterized protein n=1 Tax=Adineta ricciae TaxID=249248 RepID=A0A815PR06_ADIRI|nr:unnamed protein product [Adineta ricciae]CAF1451980.1 unnamed protein product [Adineta ricciae]
MTWLVLERHILIFHDRLASTRRKRFLFRYLPLTVLIVYVSFFYLIVIFILPCENEYNYFVPICGASPCCQTLGIIGMWEFIAHTILPVRLGGIVSVVLVIRIQLQKCRLNRSIHWHKQWRMTFQLFFVSNLNISVKFPMFTTPLTHVLDLPPNAGVQIQLYFYFVSYFIIFFFPFASLCQFPSLRIKIRKQIVMILSKCTPTVTPMLNELYMKHIR